MPRKSSRSEKKGGSGSQPKSPPTEKDAEREKEAEISRKKGTESQPKSPPAEKDAEREKGADVRHKKGTESQPKSPAPEKDAEKEKKVGILRKKGSVSQPKSPTPEKETAVPLRVLPPAAKLVRAVPVVGTAAGAAPHVILPMNIAEDGCAEASGVRSLHRKRRRGVERPSELPLLRLPKFVMKWAPLRIIGLLRPQPTRQRKTANLRQLLHEVQNREQEVLNMYTKERQRQMIVVAIIGLLCLYYAGVAGAFFYFELGERPPVTPGGRRVPLSLLRSTINSSAH